MPDDLPVFDGARFIRWEELARMVAAIRDLREEVRTLRAELTDLRARLDGPSRAAEAVEAPAPAAVELIDGWPANTGWQILPVSNRTGGTELALALGRDLGGLVRSFAGGRYFDAAPWDRRGTADEQWLGADLLDRADGAGDRRSLAVCLLCDPTRDLTVRAEVFAPDGSPRGTATLAVPAAGGFAGRFAEVVLVWAADAVRVRVSGAVVIGVGQATQPGANGRKR
jgi:hypothetical protein